MTVLEERPDADEVVWFDSVDRSIHRRELFLASTAGPEHTRNHAGVAMRFRDLNPHTTELCRTCWPVMSDEPETLPVVERSFTARLWTAADTIDGRRILPGALHWDEEALPVIDWRKPAGGRIEDAPQSIVGRLLGVAELHGIGVAIGFTTLETGSYPVAITVNLADSDTELCEPSDGFTIVLVGGKLAGVCITDTPSWPDALMVVHPAPGDPTR